MDGGLVRPAGSRRARVALVVGGVVLLAAAVGVAVLLAGRGDAGGGSGSGTAGATATSVEAAGGAGGGGAAGGAGAGGRSAGGGGTGGGSSKTTVSATTVSATSTSATTQTTVAPLQVTLSNPLASVTCKASPNGGYYDFTATFTVYVQTVGVGSLRWQWGRGAADARTPAKQYDVGRGEGLIFVASDVVRGRAPSATYQVVDRLHVLDPAGVDPVTLSHTAC
jgi:hypothetical protein